jgi:hypothetical protein
VCGPEEFGDLLGVEVGPRFDGADDRDGRGVDVVRGDTGGDQRLCRAQGGVDAPIPAPPSS